MSDSGKSYRPKLLGMPELDDVVGEIPPNYMVLIEGKPGAGKTSLALHTVCRNVRDKGSKALYITFNESKEKLLDISERIGCDLRKEIEASNVKIIEFPTIADEYIVESITQEIVKHIQEGYDLVVIDSVTPATRVLDTYSKKRSWLHTVLYKAGSVKYATLLMICDNLLENDAEVSLLEYLADVVIKLDYKPDALFPRKLHVLKFRGRKVMATPIYFCILPRGIHAVNRVRRQDAEKLMARRKEVRVNEDPARRILGSVIRPGTQISLIVKYPAMSPGYLYHYLLLKLGAEALKKGLKMSILKYGVGSDYEVPEEPLLRRALRDKLIPVHVDVSVGRIPHDIINKVPYPNELDLLVVDGYEKLMEIYGRGEVNKLIAAYHTADSMSGITTVRIFRTPPSHPHPPTSMITLSDIVIEASLNEEAKCTNLTVIKGPHIVHPETVLDTELKPFVEKLRQAIRRSIPETSRVM
ncbi:MAG: AAA family ATPase [Desulfurococcales archaeon]|nr:AAA family ATPase [Desulfurococcales archaeon]